MAVVRQDSRVETRHFRGSFRYSNISMHSFDRKFVCEAIVMNINKKTVKTCLFQSIENFRIKRFLKVRRIRFSNFGYLSEG